MKYLITSDNLSAYISLDDCVILNSEDLNNIEKIVDSIADVDVVFHTYELKGEYTDKQLFDENVWKTIGLVNAAIGAGVKRFVFLSSAEVYGDGSRNPVMDVEPITPFGNCKSVCEKYIVDSCQGTKTESFILRLFEEYPNQYWRDGQYLTSEVTGKLITSALLALGNGEIKEKITNLQLF